MFCDFISYYDVLSVSIFYMLLWGPRGKCTSNDFIECGKDGKSICCVIYEFSNINFIYLVYIWQAPKKDKAPPPSSKPAKSGGGKQKKKVICYMMTVCFKV